MHQSFEYETACSELYERSSLSLQLRALLDEGSVKDTNLFLSDEWFSALVGFRSLALIRTSTSRLGCIL